MPDNMYIGGNARITGQVGMGDKVRQTQNSAPASPEPDLFDRIAALIHEHAGELPEASRALRDLDDVRAEADAEDGDPERRDNALRRLARRVAPVAAIAEAVRQLVDALRPS
ncbi:hypothetical protein E1293_28705 [Actinomadura darangshiensis]|uniref:DUF4404 family protein n=1 Tax=Actinomadura darangshiensis TaxID=705336 RepID=A0A4R5APV0_9ACTN|nr:hypothetical protein [Actinomadura darangshiensis]TDD75078.1 hypothetical protein E1293_28705 [Actinomadura darangshiensis]